MAVSTGFREISLPSEYQLTIYLYIKAFYEVHHHFICSFFDHSLRGAAITDGSGYQNGQTAQRVYLLYHEEYITGQKSAIVSGE